MDNQKNLIVNLFNNKFNLQDFINFTQEIFKGKVKYGKNLEFSSKVKGEFNGVVKSFLNLGRYTDNNRKSMILAVVEINKEDSIARSRAIQRNFVKYYFLKGGADSALVAFYNKESEDWRLSFIKLDYSYKNSKLQEDITPAKRFSFLLGKNENHHTAMERFMPLILQDKQTPTIDELEEVFNIEVVTKEFLEKYCDLYLKIKKELDKQEGFSLVAEKSDEFAKKLMGQLVFLYFLQKKGWLGVKVNPEKISKEEADRLLDNKAYECNEVFDKVYYLNGSSYIRENKKMAELSNEEINCLNSIFINTEYDGKWGSGDKSFIRSMFKEADSCGKSFFKDYLEPIFYNALNDKRGGSTYFKDLNCKIPFLNSGLFQPISENYDYKNADFTIDNSLFSNNNKNKQGDIGDGVLDIFDRYAFTIKEDEPLEKEVAVDPEMLGKVFENLLDVKDRKKNGVFYTPREIVHYICQESLINYLVTEIGLTYDEAEVLIRYGDIVNDIDTSNNSIIGRNFKMPYTVRSQAKKIDKALENVKIADPAVGSGAFPLGMVNEIVRARMNLTYYMVDELNAVTRKYIYSKERTPYELKLRTIRRCIHAVDIERSAVDITKLRLWLSLVVEENDFRNIKALPNLDYNIMVGNSLIEEFEGVKLFNENALKIQDNKDRGEILEQLSLQIPIEDSENLKELKRTNTKPYFLWKLNFAKVFREKGGFDIVIGNPPYIGFQKVPDKEYHKEKYFSANGKYDFYVLFIEKGIDLLRKNGTISYICPSYFYKRNYGKNIRKFILENTAINYIVDFKDMQIFESVLTYTCIFMATKHLVRNNLVKIINKNLLDREYYTVKQDDFKEPLWNIENNENNVILQKIKNKSQYTLKDLTINISQGIVTGNNNIFCLEKSLIKERNITMEYLKPIYKGKDIRNGKIIESGEYLFYPYRYINNKMILIQESEIKEKDINLYNYLLENKAILLSREYFNKSNKMWYELWNPRKRCHFENRKFVFSELNNHNDFVLVEECFYSDSACGMELKKEYENCYKYLSYYLNCELMTYYFSKITVPKANGYYVYKNAFLSKLPVYIPSNLDKVDYDNFEEWIRNEFNIDNAREL